MEGHARQLLHPSDLSVPILSPSRVRVVVFRDEKGVKQTIFDSQQVNNEKGGEVRMRGGMETAGRGRGRGGGKCARKMSEGCVLGGEGTM